MTTIVLRIRPDRLDDQRRSQINALMPDARLVVTNDDAELEEALREAEIIAGSIPHELLMHAPRLRWHQQWSAGVDWLMRFPEIARRDFLLTTASGVHAIPISEHIIAMLLAFARRLPESIRAQDRHEWLQRPSQPVFELAGTMLLLIGLGAIGRRTAQVAGALGMRTAGIRRSAEPVPGVDRVAGPDALHSLLAEADFVAVSAPLAEQTKNMIGEHELRVMKSSAYIVNVGRGGTINEEALVRALREGWIAGAGLDVFETEPLPPESPLWELDNVLITAHYSGSTPHYDERALDIFIDNLRRFQAGEPLRNLVDRRRGY